MNKLLVLPYAIVRLIRSLRRRLKIVSLRLRGVSVHSNAMIDPAAVFELSGGKISIGARTFIDRGVILKAYGGFIQVGSDCSINAYAILHGNGGISMGEGVRVAPHAVIVSANHIYADPDKFIYEQGESERGVTIESDVWIGAGACVLDGVVIARGSVIGAGSVVTRATKPYSVNAGVPARQIASRK